MKAVRIRKPKKVITDKELLVLWKGYVGPWEVEDEIQEEMQGKKNPTRIEESRRLLKTWDSYLKSILAQIPNMEIYNRRVQELEDFLNVSKTNYEKIKKKIGFLEVKLENTRKKFAQELESIKSIREMKARENAQQLQLANQTDVITNLGAMMDEEERNYFTTEVELLRLKQYVLPVLLGGGGDDRESEELPSLQELDWNELRAQKREQQRRDREAGIEARMADAWFSVVNAVDVLQSVWSLQNSLPLALVPETAKALLNFMREYWGRRKRERGEGKLPTYKEVIEEFDYIAGSPETNVVFWKAFFNEAERRLEAMAPYQKAEVFNPKRTEKRGLLILPERKEEKTMMMDKSPRRSRSSSDDEGGQESMAVSPPRSRSPSPKGKEELSEQPPSMSQEEALDYLIDLLAKAASGDVPLSPEEERVLRRIPYETYQVLNDNDIRDRMRQVDPEETSPKWRLAIEEVGKRLAALEPKWAVGKLFDSMDMATRLQAALQEHGYQVSRLREDAALAKLRRFMIRNFEEDTAYLINSGSIGSMDEGLAEAIRLVESPEANLAIWRSFLLDVASRTKTARRPPGRVKVTGPPRSATPAPVVAVEPMKRVGVQDVWRLAKEFNQSIERWRALRAMINNYKHQDMSDEALRFELISTLWTSRWKEILPLHKYDRATKIRLLLENAVKYLSNEALLLFNRIYRTMSLDNLRKEVAKEEGILDDIARKLGSPPYLDFSRDGTTYINWRERFEDDEDNMEYLERLYGETQTLEGIDSAFWQLEIQAADYEKNMIRLENAPFSREVKEEWESNYHDLISLKEEMNAILEYRAAFVGTEYVPLERYERIPPWKESELETSIIEADTELRERKEQLDEFDRKPPWSLEKLKRHYTNLSAYERKFRKGLRSNASEKSLRKLHAEEMAKERKKLVGLVEYWIQRGPELRAELERVRQKKRSVPQQPQSDDEGGQESMAVSPPRSRSPSPVPKEKEELYEFSPPRRSPSPQAIVQESTKDRRNRLRREKRARDNEAKRLLSVPKAVSPPRSPRPVVIDLVSPPRSPVPAPKKKQIEVVEDEEEELPRKPANPTERVLKILGGKKRFYSRFAKKEEEKPKAKRTFKQFEEWLAETWFKAHKRSPRAEEVIDQFVIEILADLPNKRWKKFLRYLDEPTNRFLKAVLINACVACAAPLENTNRYACGAGCKTVIYCGQDCADAHWEEHNCRLVKE